MEETKAELQSIVDYLKDPEKYEKLGGKLPKGVLMVGPPGTGKTLMARAIAGEANVHFYYACGSEFEGIFVGQGAGRVRRLFASAKKKAPAVIFIDEIDTVGRKRSSGSLSSFSNQTINQLLAEMDGFEENKGIIVIAATNRVDNLDPALLRPGRFDVHVHLQLPDIHDRKEILKFYLNKIKKNDDVDVDLIARRSTEMSGADLENIVNQAALRATSDNKSDVTMEYLEAALDRVRMGTEKPKIPDAETVRKIACYESGRSLVAFHTPNAQPLHKVTVTRRGKSMGHTSFIPKESELYQTNKLQLLAMIDVLLAGRVAQELVLGTNQISASSSDDVRKATQIAVKMVKNFGMSKKTDEDT